jgi:hypothetical protein
MDGNDKKKFTDRKYIFFMRYFIHSYRKTSDFRLRMDRQFFTKSDINKNVDFHKINLMQSVKIVADPNINGSLIGES